MDRKPFQTGQQALRTLRGFKKKKKLGSDKGKNTVK